MKKNNNKGFMLAETLIVTTFVAGVLVFLFIQFSNLNNSYNDSYKYNTVEGLYSLRNVRDYIKKDSVALDVIKEDVDYSSILDVSDCNIFSDKDYCTLLFETENLKTVYIVLNQFNKTVFEEESSNIQSFVSKIKSEGTEEYRIIAEFNDDTFATIRFGD